MPFYVYIVLAVVVIIFAWVFIYENFIKDDSPTSKIYPSRKPENTLKKVLNHGAIGEPLVMYDQNISKKKLNADPYRLELPVFGAAKKGLSCGRVRIREKQISFWLKF